MNHTPCKNCKHKARSNPYCTNGKVLLNPGMADEPCITVRARLGVEVPCPGFAPTLWAWIKGDTE